MENLSFGIVLTIVGMGGTMATLWIISQLVNLLKIFFPIREEGRGQNRSHEKGG